MKAYPKEDLQMDVHTWTKGLDYEVIQRPTKTVVASNEGQLNFTGEAEQRLNEVFDFKED